MTRCRVVLSAWALLSAGTLLRAQDTPRIEILCVDPQVIHYATFQSHNQKVVHHENDVFIAYVKSRNKDYTAQEWRVLRSRDGGRSFQPFVSGVGATNPPVLEVDSAGNLYLGRVDWVRGDAFIERFQRGEDYATPRITVLPGGAAGKYAMALDEKRQQLLFFSHNNEFYRVGLDGALRSRITLLQAGQHAVLQYPLLSVDERGDIYAGWTTSTPERYLYWDIHLMRSRDGGDRWETLENKELPLPIVADDSGPAQRLTRDDEFEVHTWLCNLWAGHGKLHAMYQAQTTPARFHYVRFDLKSGREDRRLTPEFRGKNLSLNGLDGTFASSLRNPRAPIIAICKDAGRPRLAALLSDDNGQTWSDLATSIEVTAPYAISGCRELTASGDAIGIFTDCIEPGDQDQGKSKLYFYRVAAGPLLGTNPPD